MIAFFLFIFGIAFLFAPGVVKLVALGFWIAAITCFILAKEFGKKANEPIEIYTIGTYIPETVEANELRLTHEGRESSHKSKLITEAEEKEITRFTDAEKTSLNELLSDIEQAMLSQTARDTLSAREANLQLGNPKLQPIAFALRLTTWQQYVKGLMMEAAAWTILLLCLPPLFLIGRIDFTMITDEAKRELTFWVIRFSRKARRYRIRPHRILQKDGRDPILYLRSFHDDTSGHPERFVQKTYEERTAEHYNQYGPVLAIGNPKEEVPLLGALRIYFDNDIWRPGVLYLMSVAQLVIIHAGISYNTLWELGVAKQRIDPQRLVISFFPWVEHDLITRHRLYLRFKKWADKILECSLPEELGTATFIVFEPGWKPKIPNG